jgi:UPF0755 protein
VALTVLAPGSKVERRGMPDGFERTAEDREQARIRREQVRGGGEGEGARGRGDGGRGNGKTTRGKATRRPAPARRRSGRPSRARKYGGRLVALIALAVAAGAIWFLIQLYQPFHGSPHGSVTVTIPPHSTAGDVGDELVRDGVISSSFFFELRATLAGERGDLLAGTYDLQENMTYSKVLKILTTPPVAAKVTNITIIEGRTRAQINDLLRQQGVKGSYFAATRRSPLIDFAAFGAPKHTPDLEGFLFPDTYQLVEPIGISKLVDDQLKTFRTEWSHINLAYARSKQLTPYDVLIIASMVQAEAATAHDRPLIASVIYNRLRLGMPLQIDATTRYATGNYTKPLTASELNSRSPYNTRIHQGLTPTPIDNPGIASIQAAAHPANTNYLYFVVKPCGNGEQVFTSSYNQFLADAQKYQQARNAHGGKSPERCS